ncbi:TPA: helix-turn-helix domain-containing protein [Legionella pneumophila subsp. pneumophila]|nr:helix-turn-helix transcriptional regulator [Legionella pneumophila]HAT9246941.1 helix-turn-helix domain-containing protein [Legionella pneumophila subsp. pneumophila]HAT9331065.1 helix-turn-helix domain-containing protein [Legionella pneumophila subsp. pneumophila]HAT9452623.1 helix-turn-helix domain-containing protein [Legionella pneumophila subsp. pneumophila]HAT9455475.1 helix-turn-helix domain-containing protein [Legionella pneumophila subsp. pneumophila]
MINRALKIIRQFHRLTQIDLAMKLDLSKSYLSEIESGKKNISFELLEKYSKIFDIPVSSLVFFSEHLDETNTVPERFRVVIADKLLKLMEWVMTRNETKKE